MADLILNLASLKAKCDAAGATTSATNTTPSLCPNKSSITGYVTDGANRVVISGSYSDNQLVRDSGVKIKSTGRVTTAPTNKNSEWTGSNVSLINAGSGTGTMYYSLNGGSYSTSIPVASAVGSYTIYYYAASNSDYVQSSVGSITATIASSHKGHEFIDLGLPSGKKWAKTNVGASSEYTYQCLYFSFGNSTGYYKDTYVFDRDNYNSSPGAALTGNIPANATYDGAISNWGGSWRMATGAEFQELYDNCVAVDVNGNTIDSSATDKRVTMNGVIGLRYKSKINGQYIFFPCAGFAGGNGINYYQIRGEYWSSTLMDPNQGTIFYVREYALNAQYHESRFRGANIRPIIG